MTINEFALAVSRAENLVYSYSMYSLECVHKLVA